MSFGKWKYLNVFPDEVINLQREILHHHPDLQELLAKHGAKEWEVKLAEVCKFCDVVVDGDYLPEDIQKLCGILERKLIERRKDHRSILILS